MKYRHLKFYSFSLMVLLLLSGCTFLKPAKEPMDTTWLVKEPNNRKLLLFLPGLGDTLSSFHDNEIHTLIKDSCQNVDILYADAYFAYYRNRSLLTRFQQDVFSKTADYEQVYLMGVSMGGLGALLNAREYNNRINGLILLAPYLGDKETLNEILAAGSIEHWQQSDPKNDFAILWQWIKSNRHTPLFANNTYLLTGDEDARYDTHQIVRQFIPVDNYHDTSGGHNWQVWRKAIATFLADRSCPI